MKDFPNIKKEIFVRLKMKVGGGKISHYLMLWASPLRRWLGLRRERNHSQVRHGSCQAG